MMVLLEQNFGKNSGRQTRHSLLLREKAQLILDSWGRARKYSAEGGPKRDGSIRGEKTKSKTDSKPPRPTSWTGWQCIAKRAKTDPVAAIEAGTSNSVVGLMAVRRSYRPAVRNPP